MADGVVTRFRQRFARFGLDGALIGHDVITTARDFQWVLPAEGKFVLINALPPNRTPGQRRGAARSNQYQYQVFVLSDNAKVLGDHYQFEDPISKVQQAVLVDDWLIISTREGTFMLSLPAALDHDDDPM